ncbi:glycosyltransferase [Trujillonella endophytica]|uniref:Glycosyl transferases group 1 n=1 Tax=Trujillonella endophytica TaxID=673521 RepID=A0A1H8SHH7_9ACTN|nr:glycosyltransferase [Trujillella endophytica]SEO78132.1 Glycosyl transferases group 1 [Trujillella endophytica]
MKVLMMNAGHLGSDYYRVNEPVRVVHEAGLGVDVTVSRGLATTMRPTGGNEPVVDDVDAQGADVVVLQLPKTAQMLQCIHVLQAQGVAVVVEMDDLLTGVAYGSAGYDALVRKGMGRQALECARAADLVTTTTPALLAEYAPHGRGVVIPNAIPRRVAELPPAYERDPEVVTVGWAGSVAGHPYDLQEMGSGLQQALDRTRDRSRFVVLGQKWDVQDRLRLSEDPPEIPWIDDVDAYTTLIGDVFDVGIAPLRIDRFNTCKSWLKNLEYAARGVYCVRSPSAEYERLGLGRRARAPKDWAKALTVAIEDPERRREQAARDRAVVLDRHLTEYTAGSWVAAWQRAAENRDLARRKGA